jgi:hypothetical protein
MRRYVWTFILPMFLGCAGKNVVSGDGKPTAEELKRDAPSWCEEMCGKYDACQKALPCDCSGEGCECASGPQGCIDSCTEDLTSFSGSAQCVDVAVQVKGCFERSTCAELLDQANPPDCFPNQQYDSCTGNGDEDLDEPPVGGTAGSSADGFAGGSSAGGSPSVPGTAGAAGTAGYGPGGTGGSASGPSVTCNAASGSGSAGSANSGGGAYVTCEETRGDCSDGHEYGYVCVDDAAGKDFCSCFLDGAPVGALDPVLACPSVSELNSACGWNLREE